MRDWLCALCWAHDKLQRWCSCEMLHSVVHPSMRSSAAKPFSTDPCVAAASACVLQGHNPQPILHLWQWPTWLYLRPPCCLVLERVCRPLSTSSKRPCTATPAPHSSTVHAPKAGQDTGSAVGNAQAITLHGITQTVQLSRQARLKQSSLPQPWTGSETFRLTPPVWSSARPAYIDCITTHTCQCWVVPKLEHFHECCCTLLGLQGPHHVTGVLQPQRHQHTQPIDAAAVCRAMPPPAAADTCAVTQRCYQSQVLPLYCQALGACPSCLARAAAA
jgi:hypothetical protein